MTLTTLQQFFAASEEERTALLYAAKCDGYAAAMDGKNMSACEHTYSSQLHAAWECGWLEARADLKLEADWQDYRDGLEQDYIDQYERGI